MLKLEVIRIAELDYDRKDAKVNHVKSKFTAQVLNGIQIEIFRNQEKQQLQDTSPEAQEKKQEDKN